MSKPLSAPAAPGTAPSLDRLREEIDRLDDRIHDTLMERAALIAQVGAAKRKEGAQVVQPAREARMIRRLLDRHRGDLPQMAVVRIWRELVGAVSLLQTGLNVAVAEAEGASGGHWDLARDYFGSCLPMQKQASLSGTIAAVREGSATFAVLPWPEDEDPNPWWAHLFGGEEKDRLSVIVALPHGEDKGGTPPENRALVISKSSFEPSGDDNSFLLIECAPDVSRGRLVDKAKKQGLEALALFTRRAALPDMPVLHLMEVAGYVGPGDDKLEALADDLGEPRALVQCAGGYPVPPVYAKTIR